jgi:hypothetical protein
MSIETEAIAGELIASEASASAKKKTAAAKPKGAPPSKTKKAALKHPLPLLRMGAIPMILTVGLEIVGNMLRATKMACWMI